MRMGLICRAISSSVVLTRVSISRGEDDIRISSLKPQLTHSRKSAPSSEYACNLSIAEHFGQMTPAINLFLVEKTIAI